MEFLISFSLLTILSVNSKVKDPVLHLPYFEQKRKNGCEIVKEFQYIKKEKKEKIKKASGLAEISGVYPVYKSKCKGFEEFSYVLSDIVRSEYQSLLITLKDEKLEYIEVLRFEEPVKYKAPSGWMESLKTKKDLNGIDAISGATLTRSSTLNLVKLAKVLRKLAND